MARKKISPPPVNLWELGLSTIRELESEYGLLASGREEIYGCLFGRDSLISALKLLKAYEKTGDAYFLGIVRKTLFSLAQLQGTKINIESGEEPGKCIHEYRPENHDHLTKKPHRPWFVYEDNSMRNYDTVDATPLFLITAYRYLKASSDEQFIEALLPNIASALAWIFAYGDTNGDGFIDYRLHPDRTYGGLETQSWMDSSESVFHEDGSPISYPIAPLEVQAYTFLALKLWSQYYIAHDPDQALVLSGAAQALKDKFNEAFILKSKKHVSLAFALDGNGKPLSAPRSTMGHCLWASFKHPSGSIESILANELVPQVAERLLKPDLFVRSAGIRTLSSRSKHFRANSYHNGSIWPHDTSIAAEGLELFGFIKEALLVRKALYKAISHFGTPIELFVYKKGFAEYTTETGGAACRKQAWSAAGMLA